MLAQKTLAGETLVATVMSNAGLEAVIKSAGGKMVRTAVGDRNVIDEMLRHGFNFGGEQSGHLISAISALPATASSPPCKYCAS